MKCQSAIRAQSIAAPTKISDPPGATPEFAALVHHMMSPAGSGSKAAGLHSARPVRVAPDGKAAAVSNGTKVSPAVQRIGNDAEASVTPSAGAVAPDRSGVSAEAATKAAADTQAEAPLAAVLDKPVETRAAGPKGTLLVLRSPQPAKGQDAAVPVPLLVIPQIAVLKPFSLKLPEFGQRLMGVAPQNDASGKADESAAVMAPAAAVELKIRLEDKQAEANADAAPQPVQAALPKPPESISQQVHLPAVAAAQTITPLAAVAPAAAPVVAVSNPAGPPAQNHPQSGASKPDAQAHAEEAAIEQLTEQTTDQTRQQPIRAVSIDFTPDGADDIRLRLSQRAGEVHISLHSTDPALSGRLNEGVRDLVDSLSTAGYDAQAWTPDQQRRNQHSSGEPQKARRNGSPGTGGEDFGGVMQQPIKEIS